MVSDVVLFGGLPSPLQAKQRAGGNYSVNPAPMVSNASAAIAVKAQACKGMSTARIPGTENGNKACAAAVNHIVKDATGKKIANNPLSVESTEQGLEALKQQGKAREVNPRDARAGAIVTMLGSNAGHVGIVEQNPNGQPRILSNSSSRVSMSWSETLPGYQHYYPDAHIKAFELT